MGLRVTILVALVLLTSCATATFLAEPGRKVLPPATCADKYCFGSAESIKDNSSVEIGGWLLTSKKGKKVLKLDIRITNKSEEEAVTPDDIILIDASGRSLRILNPEEFVYYYHGLTSADALVTSAAMSLYAAQLQKATGYTGTMYSYSTIYGNYVSTFGTYTFYPVYSPASAFASGFAQGLALACTLKAARINRDLKESHLLALRPALTLPDRSNVGRIWSLPGELPIEVHVFVLGDHHVIVLDKVASG